MTLQFKTDISEFRIRNAIALRSDKTWIEPQITAQNTYSDHRTLTLTR